jgi:hypothetical protein
MACSLTLPQPLDYGLACPRTKVTVGIDPGVQAASRNCGLAVWDVAAKRFLSVKTLFYWEALKVLADLAEDVRFDVESVRIEDARKRKFFGASGTERFQGAGAAKTASSVLEGWVRDICRLPFVMVAPQSIGKGWRYLQADPALFNREFRWEGDTTEHARVSAIIAQLAVPPGSRKEPKKNVRPITLF